MSTTNLFSLLVLPSNVCRVTSTGVFPSYISVPLFSAIALVIASNAPALLTNSSMRSVFIPVSLASLLIDANTPVTASASRSNVHPSSVTLLHASDRRSSQLFTASENSSSDSWSSVSPSPPSPRWLRTLSCHLRIISLIKSATAISSLLPELARKGNKKRHSHPFLKHELACIVEC